MNYNEHTLTNQNEELALYTTAENSAIEFVDTIFDYEDAFGESDCAGL